MLNSTAEADDVGDYLRVKYPAEFGATDDGSSGCWSSTPTVAVRYPSGISMPLAQLPAGSMRARVRSTPLSAS